MSQHTRMPAEHDLDDIWDARSNSLLNLFKDIHEHFTILSTHILTLPAFAISSYEHTSFVLYLEQLARKDRLRVTANNAHRMISDAEYDDLLATSPTYTNASAALLNNPGYHFSVHPSRDPPVLLYQSHKQCIVPRLHDVYSIIYAFRCAFSDIREPSSIHLKICELYCFVPLDAVVEHVCRLPRIGHEGSCEHNVVPLTADSETKTPCHSPLIRSTAPSPSPLRGKDSFGVLTPPRLSGSSRRSYGIPYQLQVPGVVKSRKRGRAKEDELRSLHSTLVKTRRGSSGTVSKIRYSRRLMENVLKGRDYRARSEGVIC